MAFSKPQPHPSAPPDCPVPAAQPLSQPPRYSSEVLFAASSEIRIDHNGAVYTLRMTRSGGLILNK